MTLSDKHYQEYLDRQQHNPFAMPPNWSVKRGCITVLILGGVLFGLKWWSQPQKPIEEPASGWATILPQAEQWPVRFTDSFDGDNGVWTIGSENTDRIERQFQIVDGKYHLQALAKTPLQYIAVPKFEHSTGINFYLATDARQVEGITNSFGLIFRKADMGFGDFYTFRIEGDQFSFQAHSTAGWEKILDWTESSAIQFDQKNRLAVVGAGSHFIFFINDEYVGQADEKRIEAGIAGISFSLSDGDAGTFEFDNFELRSP